MLNLDEHVKQIHIDVKETGPAEKGIKANEVVIGISCGFGKRLNWSIKKVAHGTILKEIVAGLEEEGVDWRVIRVKHSADLGVVGNTAAKLSGSGIGIGILSKGTCLIHSKDLAPLNPLELYSVSPLLRLEDYRAIARNAAKYAKGETPIPVVQPYDGEAIGATYMARAAVMHLTEAELVDLDGVPVACQVSFEEINE